MGAGAQGRSGTLSVGLSGFGRGGSIGGPITSGMFST